MAVVSYARKPGAPSAPVATAPPVTPTAAPQPAQPNPNDEIAALRAKLAELEAAKATPAAVPQSATPQPAAPPPAAPQPTLDATTGVPVSDPAPTPAPTRRPRGKVGGNKAAPAVPTTPPAAPKVSRRVAPAQAQTETPASSPASSVPACVPRTSPGAVVQHSTQFAETGDANIGLDDLDIPRLNIVQHVGELSQTFEPGSIVLGKEVELPRPVNLCVWGFRPKRYAERVPGGGAGRILDSVQQVREAGGTTDYNEAEERKIPLFQTLSTALAFVECDQGIEGEAIEMFPFEFNGLRYAVCLWSMKGTAWTNGAKHFFTGRKVGTFRGHAAPLLRRGYEHQFVLFDTETKRYGTNFAEIPSLTLGDATTPDFQAFMRGIVVGEVVASGEAEE